jgi:hypothetical protein
LFECAYKRFEKIDFLETSRTKKLLALGSEEEGLFTRPLELMFVAISWLLVGVPR